MFAAPPPFCAFVANRFGTNSPIGGLLNMLRRAFYATSFRGFWRNWNPAYGYVLRYFCYKPLRRKLPDSVSLMVTFLACGFFLHDLPVWLVLGHPLFPIVTVAFMFWGSVVLASDRLGWGLSHLGPAARAAIHASAIASGFVFSIAVAYAYLRVGA